MDEKAVRSVDDERGVSAERVLLVAGFLAWGAVALGEAAALYFATTPRPVVVTFICSASLLLFAGAFWIVAGPRSRTRQSRIWALGLQSLSAFGVAATCRAPAEVALVLLVVISGQVRGLLPPRRALAWVVAQNVLVLPWIVAGKSWFSALLLVGSYAAFQAFAWAKAHLAHSAAEARSLYAVALVELASTQAELGEVHRNAERLRIARELHDQVGHQLTALNLQLEVAANTSGSEAAAALASARGLAKETLGDLRRVVGELRASPEIDLATALRGLAVRIREPHIRLGLPADLELKDTETAWALFRCAQEGVTNAVRHAGARHVELAVDQTPSHYQLVVEDDGCGCDDVPFGNGLTGLRERLSALGGALEVDTRNRAGFRLVALVPRSAS